MVCTAAIRDLICDRSRVGEIKDYIEEGRDQYGMQSFDQHLMDLVTEGVVTFETAKGAASNPADFELKQKTLRRLSRKATTIETEGVDPEEGKSGGKSSKNRKDEDLPEGFTDGFDMNSG